MQQQRPGGAVVERMSVAEFRHAIRNGRFCPGDAVLYWYGRQTPLSWAIRRVQVRALRDLLGTQKWDRTDLTDRTDRTDPTELQDWQAEAEQRIADCARYTHAGMLVDAEISAEMTSPRARLITWERRLRVGDRLLVVRVLRTAGSAAHGGDSGLRATQLMIEQVASRTRYPWRELLTYWFSSVPLAIAAEHWAEFFEDRERNVCSGAIWDAWCCARLVDGVTDGDAMPESWYPGRMALDERYLRRVAAVTIVDPSDLSDLSDRTDRTDATQETTMNCRRSVAVVAVLVFLALAMSGCRGGLFGGAGAEAGKPTIKLYEVNFAAGANSIAIIGSAGTQAPMYQGAEAATPAGAPLSMGVAGGLPGAAASENAGVNGGKYAMQTIKDGTKRLAETDASAAAQLMAGNTQSAGTQTPAQVQRQGTAAPTSTVTANPEHNPALQVNPATALTGQGTAQVTNPTSTLAGASSQPGAVTGGSGTGTATSGDRTDTTDRTDLTGGETATAVTANADGTKTVTTASGKTLTGKAMGPFQSGTEEVWVLLLADGTAVRLNATGANATALGQ